MSSVKACADSPDEVLTESTIPTPLTAYGKSKLKAEKYIVGSTAYNDKRRSVYILRPVMIHGEGNKGNLNLLFNFVSKGIPYPLGAFENKRSFLSLQNLLFLTERLIEKKPSSGIYNVSDDTSISTNELVELIGAALTKRSRILKLNKRFVKLLANLGDRFSIIPFDSHKLKKMSENYEVSNKKIKSSLNIESLPFSVEEGLKQTMTYFTNK